MSRNKKDWKDALGQMVFSTGTEQSKNEFFEEENHDELNASEHRVRIWLDKKGRRGKAVTSIRGIEASQRELEDLARELKKLCGVGGSVKDDEILIQGDHRKKVLEHLLKKGFSDTKIAGS